MITEVDVGFIYIIIGVHVKTANCCDSLAVCVCVCFFCVCYSQGCVCGVAMTTSSIIDEAIE